MLNRCLHTFLLAVLVSGCGDDASATAENGRVDAGIADATADSVEPDAAVGCIPPNSVEDLDDDGLLDALEDANLNCRVDAGETDPSNPDSDGDGLLDGEEDVDQDGFWDEMAGELDPRRADTDADGVPDNEELIASVCQASLLTMGSTAAMGDRMQRLYLPQGWEVVGSTERGSRVALAAGGVAMFGYNLAGEALEVEQFAAVAASALQGTGWQFGRVARADDAGSATELRISAVSPAQGTAPQPLSPAAVFASIAAEALGEAAAEPLVGPMSEFRSDAIVRYTFDPSVSGFVLTMVALDAQAGRPELATGERPTLRTQCEVAAAADAAEELHVFVALDTYGTRTTSETIVETLVQMEAERASRGLRTRVWLTRGDSHLRGAPGSPVLADSADPAEWRRATGSFFGGHADQRVWLNLLSLRQHARVSDDSAHIFVAGLRGEDSEFRLGVLNGRDGDPAEPPLPEGELRDALTSYYSQELDGPLYVFAPSADDGSNASCVDPAGGEPALEAAASGAALAYRSGGAFVARCTPRASEALAGALASSGWIWPTATLGFVPITSTVRVADAVGGIVEKAVTEQNLVRAAFATGTIEIAGAYLYWEDAQ